MKPDEISVHLDLYEISCFYELFKIGGNESIPFPVTSFTADDGLIIESKEYVDTSAIPQFQLKVKMNIKVSSYL